jgi:hypothetical protein
VLARWGWDWLAWSAGAPWFTGLDGVAGEEIPVDASWELEADGLELDVADDVGDFGHGHDRIISMWVMQAYFCGKLFSCVSIGWRGTCDDPQNKSRRNVLTDSVQSDRVWIDDERGCSSRLQKPNR